MSQYSINDIKEMLEQLPVDQIDGFIKAHQQDERKGIQKLLIQYERKLENYKAELARLEKMCSYENKYSQYNAICGIDEAGRGPLAGPVVAGAVILSKENPILYLNDSKKLSEKKREALYEEIIEKAMAYSVGIASVETIDEINILQATYEAMKEAVHALEIQPEIALIDAVTLKDFHLPQEAIIKGDAKSVSIAAGSIIAKVTRDRMMLAYDAIYPAYGFAKNKGYGTEEHIKALRKYGPCPIHRRSFIKNLLDESQ